jgi:hypothetical protein
MQLNNITYKFDSSDEGSENGLKITEDPNSHYKQCLKHGMSPMNANTVSMLCSNMLKNLEDTKTYTPAEIDELFVT